MEKKNNDKKKALYVVGIILVLIATALLVVALLTGDFSLKDALAGKMRAEIIYILLIVFLALPLLILLLAIGLRFDNKRSKKKPKVLNVSAVSLMGGNATVVANNTSTAEKTSLLPQAKEPKENEEVNEEGKSRFCKLCTLDARGMLFFYKFAEIIVEYRQIAKIMRNGLTVFKLHSKLICL